MLSTLRVASRGAVVARRAASASAFRFQAVRAASTWANVPQGPPLTAAVTGITEAFKADSFKEKINLGKYTILKPPPSCPTISRLTIVLVLTAMTRASPTSSPSVRAAEQKIVSNNLNKEYAGITGVPEFTKSAAVLAYGKDSSALDRLVITQTISGTGALRIGAAFLERFYPGAKKIYIPNPSWANHGAVFKDAGLEVEKYRYYNKDTIGLDFEGMVADIKAAPKGSIFLFHACAHNPTGVDPTAEQWKEISSVVKSSGHYAFFDMAYQGFASGDTNKDAFAVRHFVAEGHNICLAQSFAKNMGLYGERVGAFSIVAENAEEKKRIDSQVKILILNDATLYKQWLAEVKEMADRIITMRALLKDNLEKLGSKHDWSHITSQIGMFAYTGLTPAQMDSLAKEHSVYATKDGRISVAGITTGNVGRLAEAIYKVKG
ncbi:glutamate oxaloacetate transaminase 2 [Apiospora sp. TS-2023a]